MHEEVGVYNKIWEWIYDNESVYVYDIYVIASSWRHQIVFLIRVATRDIPKFTVKPVI